MTDTAILSSKFRISLPKAVREKEDWRPGQKFVFLRSVEGLLLMPVPSIAELRGLAKGADRNGVRERAERY